jgi:transcriptional regulator with XRE-family HTH domain
LQHTPCVPVLLRAWRERRGYSLRTLAERAGVGFATLHKIEQERMTPTVDLLEKLARALGIAVRDFFPPGWPAARRSRLPSERTASTRKARRSRR